MANQHGHVKYDDDCSGWKRGLGFNYGKTQSAPFQSIHYTPEN